MLVLILTSGTDKRATMTAAEVEAGRFGFAIAEPGHTCCIELNRRDAKRLKDELTRYLEENG